jgi:putative intracellular protease/amidase
MAKILFVLTGASYWTLKDGHRHPTGYWAEEFVAPYSAFTEAGHEITVATPGAVVPVVDTISLRPDIVGSEQKAREEGDVIERADELRWPIDLKDARVDDYDAVYFPGGHGPMEDLAFDADCGRLLNDALASGKPLAVVCHAPAALLSTRDAEGKSPFAGYHITGFADEEEAAFGLADKAKWLMEDEVTDKVGVEYSRGPVWEPYTVVDRNLFTGQNPASAGPLARERVLPALAAA